MAHAATSLVLHILSAHWSVTLQSHLIRSTTTVPTVRARVVSSVAFRWLGLSCPPSTWPCAGHFRRRCLVPCSGAATLGWGNPKPLPSSGVCPRSMCMSYWQDFLSWFEAGCPWG